MLIYAQANRITLYNRLCPIVTMEDDLSVVQDLEMLARSSATASTIVPSPGAYLAAQTRA